MVALASNCLEQTRHNFSVERMTARGTPPKNKKEGWVGGGRYYKQATPTEFGRAQCLTGPALLNPPDRSGSIPPKPGLGTWGRDLLTVIRQEGIGLIEGFAFSLRFGE